MIEEKPANIKGQINGQQFVASLLTGLGAGAAAVLLHLQNSAPQWAGPYAPIAIAVVSSLLMGLRYLNLGDEDDAEGN